MMLLAFVMFFVLCAFCGHHLYLGKLFDLPCAAV
jgi:hypothetical protein